MKYYFFYLYFFPLSLFCQVDTTNYLSFTTNSLYQTSFNSSKNGFNYNSNTVLDNPLFHLAIYSTIGLQKTIKDKITIISKFIVEQRSFSSGFGAINNLAYLPIINIGYQDTFLFNHRNNIAVKSNIGTFLNNSISDFLQIYNLDYQGVNITVTSKKFFLKILSIADLSYSIGLNIDELYRLSLGYKIRKGKIILSPQYMVLVPYLLPPSVNKNDFSLLTYIDRKLTNKISIKAQSIFRFNKIDGTAFANASGLSINFESHNIKIALTYRYYQKLFNYGFKDASTRYRKKNTIGSYVGEYLYPLKNYNYHFNQWAVFTELLGSKNNNLEVIFNYDKVIRDNLRLQTKIDFNIIQYTHPINLKSYLRYYPIYYLGIQLDILNSLTTRVGITNKYMDLDNFYQTFYVSYKPSFIFGVSTNFKSKLKE